jgi:Ca2+-binding EF-hand superfamily protein
MPTEFDEQIPEWVAKVVESPRNLATEKELTEQCKVALNLFIDADMDGNRQLSFQELKQLCDAAGLPVGDDEDEAMLHMDKNESGSLDIEEWVTWWLNRISSLPNPIKQQEAIARNTFQNFDRDGSGCMDASELGLLVQSLGADFSEEELLLALGEIDADGSGMVEVGEFVMWWTNRAAGNRKQASLISLKMQKLAMKAAQVFSTDIFTATWNGEAGLVKAFLEGESALAKAWDVSEYGNGWTSLHYASYRGHTEIRSAAIKRGDM